VAEKDKIKAEYQTDITFGWNEIDSAKQGPENVSKSRLQKTLEKNFNMRFPVFMKQ